MKTQENLSEFYSWVDKIIEIRLGRQKLFYSSKVDRLVTKEDILFYSSSAAADFIPGYSVSGSKILKIRTVIFLTEIESNQTG